MKSLALEVGDKAIAAARITDNNLPELVMRVPIPPLDAWIECRNLLLDVAGDDEVATIGIACLELRGNRLDTPTPGSSDQWPTGRELKSAVQRTFPAAVIRVASHRTCVLLAESYTGSYTGLISSEELALAGAGILARLECSLRIPSKTCLHQSIRRRYQDQRPT
ncbi:hypothetical protein ACWCPQ_06320 [Nocardia sp. NPDC001965]